LGKTVVVVPERGNAVVVFDGTTGAFCTSYESEKLSIATHSPWSMNPVTFLDDVRLLLLNSVPKSYPEFAVLNLKDGSLTKDDRIPPWEPG
jgi:hypothetical protein